MTRIVRARLARQRCTADTPDYRNHCAATADLLTLCTSEVAASHRRIGASPRDLWGKHGSEMNVQIFPVICVIILAVLGLGYYTVHKMNPGSFRMPGIRQSRVWCLAW